MVRTTHDCMTNLRFQLCFADDSNVYWEAPQGVQKYTYQEVEKATAGFHKDHEIGLGAFGKVFIGTFEDGRTLAVKRASATGSQGLPEFRNEVRRYTLLKLEVFMALISSDPTYTLKVSITLLQSILPFKAVQRSPVSSRSLSVLAA